MYSAQERYMVKKLRKANLPITTVKQVTGISERSIRRIEKEPESETADEASFRKKRRVGRPSQLDPYKAEILAWLSEERDPADGPMKGQEVIQRLRAKGCKVGDSTVYEYLRKVRPKEPPKPIVRFEGLPGEFSQHDFGQRRVRYADGQVEVVKFFASRLKYSRYVDIQVVANEQQETVVRCLLRAFQSFGGVPLMGVFDNMSSAVKSRDVLSEGNVKVHWTEPFMQVCMGQCKRSCHKVP